ncbi:MAG: DUF1080 domain-containing protein [Verrucomicrobia bacterium]|nr:DUF1080 domain-containing protein [Verrucomicrobiota bacterium]
MRNTTILVGAFLLCFAGCTSPSTAPKEQSLFNGKDLQGWVSMFGGEWTAADGVLTGRNGAQWTTNPEKSGSWLRTEREYGDFTLQLEYAINARGNSGVFIHSALEKNPAFSGHEVQILDDHGQAPKKYTTGSLYDVVAPAKNMSKPAGEWNALQISCAGPHIEVVMNGEKIVDYNTDRRTRGYIGLQNHDTNAVVRFRNIRVTER